MENTYIYIYILYKYIQGFIYAYIAWIYGYMAIYSLAHSLSCIYMYIYIYIQYETLNHHVQATGNAESCTQYSITIQQSPPETTVGFYQETSW